MERIFVAFRWLMERISPNCMLACVPVISARRYTRGAKNWAFLEPRAASKRHFVVSSSGLSGLHPALPPMAESLGALSSTKFDGEVIENEKRGC